MKILQLSIEVNSGSLGRIAEQIGVKIIEKNWKSYITFARNNQPSKSTAIKIGRNSDIIWHGYYINIKILFNYLRQSRAKIVWTFHDCWSFTGHCAHFEYVNCNKWKSLCSKCPQIGSYPQSF